jgi:TATA-box binding protein (TBP) (component of TFIID and TFIIIB)
MEYVVNMNYSRLKKPINLKRLNVPHSKYHTIPHQLVIKNDEGTILFFSSGKFRVMGCIDAIDAAFLLVKYTDLIDTNDIPELYSQSYTSVVKLGCEINLDKLSKCENTIYMPELFAAVRISKYKPVSVNVFCTGSVVVCGLKEPEHIHAILFDLKILINDSIMK